MKKLFLMFILLCTAVIGALAQNTSPESLSGEWTRVWSDEFNGTTLNTAVWNVEQVTNPANNELQRYNNDGVSVSDGYLVLTAKRETNSSDTRSFTSGRVNSQGKYTFKYGKIEARVKIPKTYQGLWPAFWMMGDDIGSVGWPACGELDIFEMGHSGGFTSKDASERFLNGCLHYGTSDDHKQSPDPSRTLDFSVQGEYVIFGCEWNVNQIRCYVRKDGVNTEETTYFTQANTRDAANYFNKPFHILFNLAVGGDFPGILDPAGVTALPNAESTASMYVDYVAVYKKASVAPVDGNYFNASTTTMDSYFGQPGETWDPETNSSASWDSTTGTGSINIRQNKSQQWKAQYKLKTSDIELDPSKQYKFSCNINSNDAVNNVTVKLFDDSELSYVNNYSLYAGDNTYESTFNGGSVGNGVIVFDFGFAKSEDQFTISEIKIEEVGSVATFPSSAAPVPTQSAANVKSLYSDSYTFAPSSLASYNESWEQTTQLVSEVIDENHYLHYSNFNHIGWEFANTYFSDMKYLHIDVCPKTSGTLNVYPISIKDGVKTDYIKYTLTGLTAGQWKSFDIPLSEFAGLDLSSIFQMKFADGSDGFNEFCIDNVYFYKEAETPSTENNFYIAGGFNGWGDIDTAIELVKQANGTYTATVTDFRLTNQGFQVVKNNWEGQYGNTGVVSKNMEFNLEKVLSEDKSNYNIFIGTRGQDVTLNGNVTFTLTLNDAGEPAKLKIEHITYQTKVPVDAEQKPDPRDYDSSNNKINLWDTSASAPKAIFEINGIKQFDVEPVNGVYTYTINGATTKEWGAQFRKDISQTEENSSNVNVSLFDEFFYDITFKIKTEEPNNAHDGHLSVKIEGSATGNRDIDGGEFIVNEMHGEFKGLELTGDGYYTYRLMNIPGKDVRGAILVVDYSKAAVGTEITISDVNIWEHENFHIPALIDGDVYIKDANELQGLAMAIANEEEPAYAKANVYLTADVDTKDITTHSKYIGIGTAEKPFTGTFKSVNVTWDSNGNLVKNASGNVIRTDAQHSVTLTSTETGVFRFVQDATITGVDVKGSVSPITNDGAGLINKAQGNVTIEKCSNAAVVKSEVVSNIGGIIGKFESKDSGTNPGHITIRNVVNRGDITAKEKVGGIIGRVDDSNITLINVLNEATITATSTSTNSANAAGLVGCQAGDNTDNNNDGGKKTTVIVTNSGNAGDINGRNESAAFFGYMASRNTATKFTNCYNSGTITGQDGNNNLVRIHADSPLNPTRGDVNDKIKIMDNVYDASAPAGTTTAPTDEQKIQGWVAKNDAARTPWTMTDVIDGALLKTLNGTSVDADVRQWKQTILADAHPVFDPGTAPELNIEVMHKTNTTAIVNIPAINVDGVPVKIEYGWIDPADSNTSKTVTEKYPQTVYTKAGVPTYIPMMNLKPETNQSVWVTIGEMETKEVPFTTITHQVTSDMPEEARGELMHYDVIPIIDYKTTTWSYHDVENYSADQVNGVYSYTMQDGSHAQWSAQFRKHLDDENGKMVSLREGYVYDLKFTVKVPEGHKTELIAKLESSETGWRGGDGAINISTDNHGLLLPGELSGDGYVFEAHNLRVNKDKDGNATGHSIIPGAILVIDLCNSSAPTDVVISNLSVVEKLDEDQQTDIDINKLNTQLYADKTRVTNTTVTLDLKGYDAPGVVDNKIEGKTVIYTITTNIGTEETPNILTWKTTGKAGKNTPYVVSGLEPGTDYVFNVTAKLEEDDSAVGSEKQVSATTLSYDHVYNGMLFQDNHKNKDYNKENGTDNLNTWFEYYEGDPTKHDEFSGQYPVIPDVKLEEMPYSIGFNLVNKGTVEEPEWHLVGGIDELSTKIGAIVNPTIWIDTTGDGERNYQLDNAKGVPGDFDANISEYISDFNPTNARVDFRFPFWSHGMINTGYLKVKEPDATSLTLNAGVSKTTQTSAILNMKAENGTTGSVTYTISRVEENGDKVYVGTTVGTAGQIVEFPVNGLSPDTQYTYEIVANDGTYTDTKVVYPKTLPEDFEPIANFDNEIDGTAKYVWFNGTSSTDRKTVDYTYKFNLTKNDNGTLTVRGGVYNSEGKTENVADAVGIVLPHIFINKIDANGTPISSTFLDVQANAGSAADFTYTTPDPDDIGYDNYKFKANDIIEYKVKYEYNGLNGESQFTTATERFIIDEDGAALRHYFSEDFKTLDEYTGKSNKIGLKRTLRDGSWNTFCVPFNVPRNILNSVICKNGMTYELKELDGLEVSGNNYTMKFKTLGGDAPVVAGNPYLIRITGYGEGYNSDDESIKNDDANVYGTITSLQINGESLSLALNTFKPEKVEYESDEVSNSSIAFQACYTFLDWGNLVPLGAYIINRNEIYFVNSNVRMKGFRGYFFTDQGITENKSHEEGKPTEPAPAKFNVFYKFIDEDNNDIMTAVEKDGVLVPVTDNDEPLYNINGQRVSRSAKGILIQNGRKFINK